MNQPTILGPCTLYLGDCLELLPTLGPVDAVVTDPPYGIGHPCNYLSRGRSNMAPCNDYPDVAGDDAPFDPHPWLGFSRVVLFGANHFADKLPPSSGWLVWDKERPEDLDQATCELAWTNCVKGVRRFRYLWDGFRKAGEKQISNVHPTQKPIALMEWVLCLRWLQDAQSVLDPFMGSGTTGIACIRTGRKFIGIEKEPKYFDIACERIDRELRQGTLSL